MSIRRKTLRLIVMAVLVAGFLVGNPLPASPQSATPPGTTTPKGRGGPFVVLDKDFWEAMERLSRSQGEVSGDRQEPLLEQISLATQYTVKTNLTIIKQNERIIELLEEMNRNTQPRNVKP